MAGLVTLAHVPMLMMSDEAGCRLDTPAQGAGLVAKLLERPAATESRYWSRTSGWNGIIGGKRMMGS